MAKFERVPFRFEYNVLEPHFDAKTMEIHSEKHHQAYTDKLNTAIEKYPELSEKSIEDLLMNLDSLAEDIRTVVRNNGGGFYNHNHFFSILAPHTSGAPVGTLAEDIHKSFGSFEKFKEEFSNAALNQFGSGWAWLATDENGQNLHIHGHPNQDNPLMHGHKPVLGLDVWEHAYYLHYQNKRPDYIAAFWNVVDWEMVNEGYSKLKD